ncbi:MAG: hypothetical protein K9J16_08890 [Melioribacteraceae bacterium]|nr:hypothetical protein [Melioribacteraceae bacterium]MCF8353965.1 hypothetical protein [Melioribacteraceae bacterium]MCF8393693.1 hypothetical protein [Melioribacteraceae bacterium]MCF8419565.1 hypothetical protein [Melioribacteraceae bacterium]
MGFIRYILFFLVIYLIFKLVRMVFKSFFTSKKEDDSRFGRKEKMSNKSKISQDDIIEAEFEEIKTESEEKKQKS